MAETGADIRILCQVKDVHKCVVLMATLSEKSRKFLSGEYVSQSILFVKIRQNQS